MQRRRIDWTRITQQVLSLLALLVQKQNTDAKVRAPPLMATDTGALSLLALLVQKYQY